MWRSTLLQPHAGATTIFIDELGARCLEGRLKSRNRSRISLPASDFKISDSRNRHNRCARQLFARYPQHRPSTEALFGCYH